MVKYFTESKQNTGSHLRTLKCALKNVHAENCYTETEYKHNIKSEAKQYFFRRVDGKGRSKMSRILI